MAIDLEAIRKKVEQLQGVRNNSRVQLWKPLPGTYKVRGLPWKNPDDGQPFKERWFYYLGKNSGILAPSQFGKPDPIQELRSKLYESGKPDDKLLAKKLKPKMRAYMPVVTRGDDASDEVLVWSFGKIVYQRLLGFFLAPGDMPSADFLDPKEGFDLKVTITKIQGKMYNDTQVDAVPRVSALNDSDEKIKSILESVPNIDDMYRLKTYSEIETVLNSWLEADDDDDQSNDYSSGTSRNSSKTPDALDELVADVKSDSTEKFSEKVEKSVSKKSSPKKKSEETESTSQGKSLDAAFEDLMTDE